MLRVDLLIEKTAANKYFSQNFLRDIFLRIIHNVHKIQLTLRCFS